MSGRRNLVRFVCAATVLFALAGCGASVSSSSSNSSQAVQKDILLSWNPNPDVVAGYIVYYGNSGTTATNTASVLSINDPTFTASAPSVTYDAQADLGISSGENICFRIRAYDTAGTFSDWSTAICNTI